MTVDFIVTRILPVIWAIWVIGYLWFRIQWIRGKVKIEIKEKK